MSSLDKVRSHGDKIARRRDDVNKGNSIRPMLKTFAVLGPLDEDQGLGPSDIYQIIGRGGGARFESRFSV